MAGLSPLTDRAAVLKAIAEYDTVGRDAFLDRYGFGRAKWWYLVHNGKQYDSKAVTGAAMGHQTGTPLTAIDFKGGEASAVRKLQSLGFRVVRSEITDESSRLPEEVPASFPEGLRSTVAVNRAERSAAARLACIELHGTACSVCGIEFGEAYGPEFGGLVHVHHLTPLAGRTELRQVDPRTDLCPVCPNCHAAIHHGGANRSLDDVRRSLKR
jgi:5-methylcytosine-specific restriction protein A